jgi:hypothetical protein
VLVAVSPFAKSATSGHPLIDDRFYFSYLKKTGEDFIYYTSSYSANQISTLYPGAERNLRVVRPYEERNLGHILFARQIEIPENSKVVFFLYTEILVFCFLFLNYHKSFSIVLVSSNNISERRVRLYPIRLWIFFRVLKRRLVRLVLDSEFQVKLVAKISRQAARKCYVRKNHLACRPSNAISRAEGRKISISFFGPEKEEKPIAPLIELIRADTGGEIVYKIYNVAEDTIRGYFHPEKIPENVVIERGWLDYKDYLRRFSESSLVLLTHTQSFNGKLSGNLCDCAALGVPYISLPLEPVVSWAAKHGPLGFLCDFSQPGWAQGLLREINPVTIAACEENLRSLSAEYTVEEVSKSLGEALLIQGIQ